MSGPLEGVRVVELAAIGPAPLGVMLLADLGAEVVRVDRVAAAEGAPGAEITMHGLSRNRRSVAVDLKHHRGREVVLELTDRADVFVEGFRPGVAERLGVGPGVCRDRNPGLIYARMTGWGQEGPLSGTAGHDIDYAAVAGALHPTGWPDRPPRPPLNLLADFGGGGTYLAVGVLAALLERELGSGEGQVVDAAMVDGTASLTAFFHGLRRLGVFDDERGSNMLDGAAHFYRTYETADGRYMAVGAIEEQFYDELLERLGLDPDQWPQHDPERWPELAERMGEVFAGRTREEWVEVFAGSDACVAPVLPLAEAPDHPHLDARDTFVEVDGAPQPAPAPRLSRTPGEVRSGAPDYGEHTDEVLAEVGYDAETVAELRSEGAVA